MHNLNKLPNNWRWCKLGDVCNLLNGYAFKSTDYVKRSNTLNIRMSNIRPDGNFDADYNARYLPDSFAAEYKNYSLKDGDLIIAMTDMAGDPKILGVPTLVNKSDNRFYLLNQRVGKLYDFKLDTVDIKYIRYVLNTTDIKDYYKSIAGGGVQINIGKQQILSVSIPLPPLGEQKRIVEKLDGLFAKIDEAIGLLDESIASASALLLSALNEVFGELSEKFNIVDIGKILNTLTDYHANGSYEILKQNVELKETEEYALMVRATDLENNFKTDLKYITESAYNFLEKTKIFGNEIIMPKIGTIGSVYLMPTIEKPCSLAMNIFLLRCNPKITINKYLYLYLVSPRGKECILSKANGAVSKTITKDAVRSIKIPLPPLDIQAGTVEHLDAVREKSERLTAKLKTQREELVALKASLLERAFKGEL